MRAGRLLSTDPPIRCKFSKEGPQGVSRVGLVYLSKLMPCGEECSAQKKKASVGSVGEGLSIGTIGKMVRCEFKNVGANQR